MEIIENVVQLLAFEGYGVPTPVAEFFDDSWVRIRLERRDEPSLVGIDQVHRPVVEKALIVQQECPRQPPAGRNGLVDVELLPA